MDKKKEERLARAVKELSKLPGNRRCCDCTEKLPQYANLTFATFICTACSGIHREFSHRVKSISLSTFSLEEVKALKEGGNEACARLYLAKWDPRDYPEPEAGQEQRVRDWIRAKYIEKRWHVDSNYVPRMRAGSRDADFGGARRGSYDPHPTGGGGGLSRSRAGSGGGGVGGSSTRSLGGSSGVPQSQPISAVLPDVRQVQVQRPQQQAPKKPQSIDLLDLAFGPSSPERPPPHQVQASQGGFAADPFASQPGVVGGGGAGLGASLSLGTSASQQGAPTATASWGAFPPSAQADPFATPHFPAPPAPLMAAPVAPSLYPPPIPPAPQQQPMLPQQPYAAGGWAQPPQPQQQPQQPPPAQAPVGYGGGGHGYGGGPSAPAAPAPGIVQLLPPGAVRPLAPAGPPKPPPTLSIEDAFSGLGLDGSGPGAGGAGAGGLGGSVAGGVGGQGQHGQGQQQQLPTFVAGEEVIYTDSQGNRSRTTVVKVHTDDHPPYYTIRLAGGAERQTDFHHIAKLAPPQQPPTAPAGPTGSGVGLGGGPTGGGAWGAEVGKAPPAVAYPPQGFAGAGVGPYGFPAAAAAPQPQGGAQQANPFLAPAAPGGVQQVQQPQQPQQQAPVSGNPFDMF